MPERLVCFDAGFTLIRPRQTMAERLRDVLAAHGHEAGEEDVRVAWEAADAWFWESYHMPGNPTWASDEQIEQTWRSYHRLMLGRLGFADLEHDLVGAILASQFAVDAWEPYEDTIEALEQLRRADDADRPAVAIVSDWASTLGEVIDAVGLRRYVDVVLASGAEGLAKPSPEFFLLACRRTGVAPEASVMIGDSYRADVLGARSAGLAGILLDRAGTANEADPAVPVVTSLTAAVRLALKPGLTPQAPGLSAQPPEVPRTVDPAYQRDS